MRKPNLYDITMHRVSLDIARVYRDVYNNPQSDHADVEALLNAFRATRRCIGIGNDGKRYGAAEVSEVMQGLEM